MTKTTRSSCFRRVSSPAAGRSRIARARRLRFETLEERLPLATFYATSLTDAVTPGTLRGAVIQANATPGGDTIVLRAGTYRLTLAGAGEDAAATGDLDILQNLTIEGAGETQTIIDAIALGDRVFDARNANLIIKNATIRGGRAEQGGALSMVDGALTLRNCRLTDNVAAGVDGGNGQGGAVYQQGGSLVIQRSRFNANQAGGGTNAVHSGFGLGGAIFLDNSMATISRSMFSDNRASGAAGSETAAAGMGAGGAIRAFASSVRVTSSSFLGNIAVGGSGRDGSVQGGAGGEGVGGAISVQSRGTLVLQNSTLDGNTAQGGSGGNGPAGGTAGVARGGGIYAAFDATATIQNSTLVANQALGGSGGTGRETSDPLALDGAGGAAYGGGFQGFIDTRVTMSGSTLRDNSAIGGRGGNAGPGGSGGSGGVGQGGGVWSASEATFGDTLAVSNSRLMNNVAIGGTAGAGEAGDGRGGAASGGAAAIGSGVATTVTRSRFLSNLALGRGAGAGGAIDALAAPLAIRDSLFGDNQALGGTASFGAGGAIHGKGSTLALSGSTFRRNLARGGTGIDRYDGGSGQGGAIFAIEGSAAVTACTFDTNQAIGGVGGSSSDGGSGLGGAIQSVDGGLDVSRSTFANGLARGGAAATGNAVGSAAGGAIHADPASTLVVTGSTVRRNRALGSTGRGGGIYLEPGSGSGQIRQSVVVQNSASTAGNDIFGPYNSPAVTIEWVTVGDPGNANDTINTGSNPNFGAVGYVYRLGKHEVTIQQYTVFLNAVAKSDPYSLYDARMETDLNIAGILRSGTSGSYAYSVIDNAGDSSDRPIAYVTWFDAARFANWMHNGQGGGDTETGAYTLAGATAGDAVSRNAGALFSIPTENEWYKAAFYSPVKGDDGTPGYFTFATQSDAVPGNTIGSDPNQVNWYVGVYPDGAYATGGGRQVSTQNYLTDVGVFTNSASYYGTFDQSGGLYEWNDFDGAPGPTRGLRGGAWYVGGAVGVSSSERLAYDPASEHEYIGFRLAGPIL